MAWFQVRHPEALVTTDYGRLLLLKLGLVAGLLGLAALNRFRLTPALVRGDTGAAGRLGSSILAETGLVVAILLATAALGTTPPPRALGATASMDASDAHAHEEHGHGHAHAGADLSLRLSGEGPQAMVVLEPRPDGAYAATIILVDPEGHPLNVLEVALRLSHPGRGIAALERPAQRDSVGAWHIPELVLAVAGEWEVELDVLVSDFERRTLTGTINLN
jgi:copper transport protein